MDDALHAQQNVPGHFKNAREPVSWQNAQATAFFADAPSPFKEIYELNLRLPVSLHESIANQLRFFAAMEGPARPFSTKNSFWDETPKWHTPDASFADMKSFVCNTLQTENIQNFFTIGLTEGPTEIQIHGEHNPNIGKALYGISGEFRAALKLVYDRGTEQGDHKPLLALLDAIGNWCFDGSINQLNKFLQDHALSDADLSLVPNLDGKTTLDAKAAEYARVFRLHQARLFASETGSFAQDKKGNLAPAFEKKYFNPSLFLKYLESSESASMLTPEERRAFLESAMGMHLFSHP
jgi:hypothetical protein